MAYPLGPVFVEKVNGFLSLWGRAFGRASLPSWLLLGGKEKGPLTEFLGLRCGEWVLLDCGDDASCLLAGRQASVLVQR